MNLIQKKIIKPGTRVLVRSSLNVPLGKNGEIVDAFRLEESKRTISFLQEAGAKVIVIGHIGRLKKSLENVSKVFPIENKFISSILGENVFFSINDMENGDVIMLENLRQDDREIENDDSFSRSLSELADIYVFDSFEVSHRMHSSVVGVPKFIESYCGIQFSKELNTLSKSFNLSDPSTSLCILGGAKVETKLPLLEKFIDKFGKVFAGGVLLNVILDNFGYSVGQSSSPPFPISKNFLKEKNFIFPKDLIVRDGDCNVRETEIERVRQYETIVDVGSETTKMIQDMVSQSTFVLWNGPLGIYEDGFDASSIGIADAINKNRENQFSIVGGGDLVSFFTSQGRGASFVSTGGGSMLHYLLHESLPAISALEKSL